MERFLARISDNLTIDDQTNQKINGQALKQDIFQAMHWLAPYSTILLAEKNSYQWVVVFCACLCSGKHLHILDEAVDLWKLCESIKPDILVTAGSEGPVGVPTLSAQALLTQKPSHSEGPELREGHLYLYTTGTARESRSILFHGRQAADHAYLQAQELGLKETDKIAVLPPFSHAYGLSALLSALQCGSHLVILQDSLSLFKFCRSEYTDGLFLQPAVLQILAAHQSILNRLKNTRLIACAGAKLEPAVYARCRDQGLPVVNIYGSTETGMCFIGATRKGGSPGHFFLSGCMRSQLSDADELLVRGDNLGRRGDTGEPLTDEQGWYHTGDLADQNPDGSFSIVGRKGDVIVLNSGYKINIEQLEATIARIAKVTDCQVLAQTLMGVDQLVLVVQEPLSIALPELNRQLRYYERIARVKQVGVIRKKRGKKIRMSKDRIMLEMSKIMAQIAPEKGEWDRISGELPFFKAMDFGSLTSLQFILSMEESLGITVDILEFDPEFTLEQLIAFFMEQSAAAKEAAQS